MDENQINKPKELKVILLGDSGVGKTNLINTSVGKLFEEKSSSTINATSSKINYEINGQKYEVNLWDTAGQERYDSITKIFLKNSEIVLFVYDITDEKSFESLDKWIINVKEMLDNHYISAILGNKMDLFLNENVKEEDARDYAQSKGMKFQLVSAKDNPKIFSIFLRELIEELEGLSKYPERVSIKLNEETKGKKNVFAKLLFFIYYYFFLLIKYYYYHI